MKIGKKIIPTVAICSVLFLAAVSVAIDEDETITDPAGDVTNFDWWGVSEEVITGVVTEHPDVEVDNIDLIEVTYTRSGTSVTAEIRVEGVIEDRGQDPVSSDIWDDMFGIFESISYGFDLIMLQNGSTALYQISYTNETCTIMYPAGIDYENLTDWSIENDNTLVINFELETEDETYDSMQATTMFLKMDLSFEDIDDPDALEEAFIALSDQAPNLPLIVFAATKNNVNTGVVGVPIQFNGTAAFGEPPYSYHWDFGDGSTSTEKNPTHAYTEAGNYTYNLTVTDASGEKEWDLGLGKLTIVAEDEGGTPGFEILIAFVAIACILLLKRRYTQ